MTLSRCKAREEFEILLFTLFENDLLLFFEQGGDLPEALFEVSLSVIISLDGEEVVDPLVVELGKDLEELTLGVLLGPKEIGVAVHVTVFWHQSLVLVRHLKVVVGFFSVLLGDVSQLIDIEVVLIFEEEGLATILLAI